MALAVVGGGSAIGRHVVRLLSANYSDVRLADMYPFRPGVYRLQEEIEPKQVRKFALSYPTSLKLALTGAEHVVVVTHDYFKLAHSKNFFVERTAFFTKELGIKKLTLLCPLSYDQLNPLDGDPAALIKSSETKAKQLMPSLSILRTNLIFGAVACDPLLSYALEAFSVGKSPLFPRDGRTKFQPVHEDEVVGALQHLKPGEDVSLAGPEVMTWGEVVNALRGFVGRTDVTMGGGLETIRSLVATNQWVGDLFYASHIQQMYWLLKQDRLPRPSKLGVKRLVDTYPAGQFKPLPAKRWWSVILD